MGVEVVDDVDDEVDDGEVVAVVVWYVAVVPALHLSAPRYSIDPIHSDYSKCIYSPHLILYCIITGSH